MPPLSPFPFPPIIHREKILLPPLLLLLYYKLLLLRRKKQKSLLCQQDDISKSSSTANELGLANVGGVFVVLMGGMGIACVIAVCEFVWKSRKVAIEERVSEVR